MSKTDAGDRSLLIGIHSVDSALAREQGVQVVTESRAVLDRRSEDQRHQDILAEFQADNLFTEKELPALLDSIGEPALILVLDGVQDPHTLGACLRTAEAAGAGLVVLPKDKSARLTPAARRAASGAAETLPILFATNLARTLKALKANGIWLAGTTDQAEQSLFEADLGGPLALVMGSEGKGMRRLTAELCDFHVRIPMQGTVASLNVSVATAVCLYEIVRQRSTT